MNSFCQKNASPVETKSCVLLIQASACSRKTTETPGGVRVQAESFHGETTE